MTSLKGSGAVAVVALVIAVLAAIRLLAFADWDPTVSVAFGEEATLTLDYAEEKLGRDVLTRATTGHDGRFFFVQSNDPWILDPEENALIMDRPVYRSQRMLYPVLAGGAGFFSPQVIAWSLLVVNVVFIALGSVAVGLIARKHGVTHWAGLAFALNFGLLFEVFIDGAGVVAFALVCIGAWALEEERLVFASVAFAAAALTREAMLVFVGFVALFWLIRRRKIPWILGLPAVSAVVLWAIYVRMRIDVPEDLDPVNAITSVPFSGVAEALTSGRAAPVDLATILLFVMLLVVVPVRAWRSDVYLTWGAAGFAVLAPFLTVFVWQKSFDISRALAPLVTVFVLELLLARKRARVPAFTS